MFGRSGVMSLNEFGRYGVLSPYGADFRLMAFQETILETRSRLVCIPLFVEKHASLIIVN